MASIDGGHYFLTVLAPISNDLEEGSSGEATAPMIRLREVLALMPTAQQTPASAASGRNSPFAKSSMTHFSRFSVISRLGFNGVQSPDPIKSSLGVSDPLVRHDDLNGHYLLWAAEFDAPSGSPPRDLAVYLRDLWGVMEEDLRRVFSHCYGFDEHTIRNAADFIDYISKCEIETTLPFNYYWADPPKLPTVTVKGLMIHSALPGVIAGGALWAALHYLVSAPLWLSITLGVLLAIGLFLFVAVRTILVAGEKPFPTSPDGSLPSVLKAMHIQHELTNFAVAKQAASADDLYTEFGKFLGDAKPGEAQPSHPAGVACSGHEEDHPGDHPGHGHHEHEEDAH